MAVSRVVFTYVDGKQVFTVPPGYDSNIRYHAWGGGGGAGGASGGNSGGNGSAGNYVTGTFPVRVGDEIEIAVGGGGTLGATVNSGRKIASAEQPGIDSNTTSLPGCFGVVPDATGDQYYPVYGDQLVTRTWPNWGSFMNTYAVWPNNSQRGPSEETWDNQIWFPQDGRYTFAFAADNEASFFLDGVRIATTAQTFKSATGDLRTITVTRGLHTLRIEGKNYPGDSTNPVGVACVIEASSNYLKFNPSNANFQPPAYLNMIWNTRLGQSVELTSSVPIWAAPLCTFYQPTSPYDWGSFSADRNFAFVSDVNTWTAEELAKLNFTTNNIYSISKPVLVSGIGDIEHFMTTGYYRFKRGESWAQARYNWLGDPQNNISIPIDKQVPSSWIPRQNMTYAGGGRQRNQLFATWNLPVPAPDEIYVVGFVDAQIRTQTPLRGSSNLRWTVNLTDGNDYGGGTSGSSATNVGTGLLNFYGGWGGNQGEQTIAGGGGGGGGASTISILNPTTAVVTEPIEGLVARWYQNLVLNSVVQIGSWYNSAPVPPSGTTLFIGTTQRTAGKADMPSVGKPSVYFATASAQNQVNVPTSPPLNLSGLNSSGQPKDFTIEAWVYATGPGTNISGFGGIIVNKDFEYEVARFGNGRIGIAVDWGQGAANSLPGSGWMFTNYFLPLNEAHILSWVFQGNNLILYVDGEVRWSAAVDGFLSGGTSGTLIRTVFRNTPRTTNAALWVGGRPSLQQQFQGYITDVRLWNVARTQQQIQASLNDVTPRTTRVRNAVNIAVASGGGGGGGAGSRSSGRDASAGYQAIVAVNPNGRSAGAAGQFVVAAGAGGGGGGGGGADGGRGGSAGIDGELGSGGGGATAGKSGVTVNLTGFPRADYAIVGRGGNGGGNESGGGGGGGQVITGSVTLRKSQRIEIGGAGDRDGNWEGVSAIRFTETEYIAAGPGGRGGERDAEYGRTGDGQPGGVPESNSRTPIWGGSGGGAGVGNRKAAAKGGPSSTWSAIDKAPGTKSSFQNNGGNSAGSPTYNSGGGGGASTSGQPGEGGKAGNGGSGRDVTVGGKTYTLGAGGGGAAGFNSRGYQFVGLGGRGGGGDGMSGIGPGLEYTVPGEYAFTVPRGVTTMYIDGVGAGGGGGSGADRGSGGGGSGGYLPRTAFTVYPGRRVSFTVGRGGKSGENGGATTIRIFDNTGSLATNITLSGGRPGSSFPTSTPRGGAGGSPNGNAGGDGGKELNDFYYSGTGASSPYGEGGKDASTNPKDDANSRRPGNGDGFGAGGGGGYKGRDGGLGSGGFLRVEWQGVDSKVGTPNTGSGGGGGFEDSGGEGGTGFCVIAYPGDPRYQYIVNNRPVEPLVQNGYTIHECTQTGDLVWIDPTSTGEIRQGDGVNPAATNVTGYINGAGSGGFGRDPAVYPVRSALYPQFLNNHGVWERDPNATNFDRSFQVTFAQSTEYILTCYADNGAQVKIDGGVVLDLTPATRDNGSYWYRNGLTARRSISAGPRTISWQATNLSTAGAFALTIAPASNPGLLVFDSRRPPVTGGSGSGGNGLVILEFPVVEGASQIKVTGADGVPVWRKIQDTWVKIDGAWKKVQASWVKINGAWKSLFGAVGVTSRIDRTNFGPAPRPDSAREVTCIAVVDETDNSLTDAAFNAEWAKFRSNFPFRPFWLLVPPYPGLGVYVPEGYNASNFAYGPQDVNRDGGNPRLASDWFTITGCDKLAPGSRVALAIDASASLTRATVQASINLFLDQCKAANLNVVLNTDFKGENYIAPFQRNF